MIAKKKAKRLIIYNARLILKDGIRKKSWILIKDGKIEKCGINKRIPSKDFEIIDAKNNYLAPGFIDLHIHGELKGISQEHSKYGTTGFLLSLHADRIERVCRKIKKISRIRLSHAQCLGFHLEGPFLNKEMAGAQPKRFIITPNPKLLKRLLRCVGKKIKIVTLACELKGSASLIKILKTNRIVAGLGHTKASFEQAKKAVTMGARYSTHVFNRMGAVSSRSPGVVTEILIDNKVTAEIIADGKHVHPALLKLLVKSKPEDKIVLVTDSVAAMDSSTRKIISGVYRLENFTIAGSKLTMIEAIKNIMKFCDIDLVRAVKMASFSPARTIGLARSKGSIEAGKDADIVLFDERFKVKMTLVGGKLVYRSK